jgi:hypothetical protein
MGAPGYSSNFVAQIPRHLFGILETRAQRILVTYRLRKAIGLVLVRL